MLAIWKIRLPPIGLCRSSSTVIVDRDTTVVRVHAEFNAQDKQMAPRSSTQSHPLKVSDVSQSVHHDFQRQSSVLVLDKYRASTTEKGEVGVMNSEKKQESKTLL